MFENAKQLEGIFLKVKAGKTLGRPEGYESL